MTRCFQSVALLPTCLSNFKAMRKFKLSIAWLRDVTRSYEKTSYSILKRAPGRCSGHSEIFINVTQHGRMMGIFSLCLHLIPFSIYDLARPQLMEEDVKCLMFLLIALTLVSHRWTTGLDLSKIVASRTKAHYQSLRNLSFKHQRAYRVYELRTTWQLLCGYQNFRTEVLTFIICVPCVAAGNWLLIETAGFIYS